MFHPIGSFVERFPPWHHARMGLRNWIILLWAGAALALPPPVTIAVIDTGFDLDHEILRPRLHRGETDEEGALPAAAGVPHEFDDLQDNTHLKTAVLTGTSLQEVLLYRTLRAKSHQQGLSPDERAWMERQHSDPAFKENLKVFKRHVHGTVVAGIALKEGAGISVLPLRGVGVDVPAVVVEGDAEKISPIMRRSEAEFHRQVALSADRVVRKFGRLLDYIARQRIPVVNASYGVTEKHITRRFGELHREITGLALDPLRLRQVVDGYFEGLYARAGQVLDRHPQTLFVFSAGNSGQDNDNHHHFPSRLRRPHVISVAALNTDSLAAFSNWGVAHVDVAAPGVGIRSLVPSVYAQATGLQHIPANGTSMAAPFVANVAARCLQLNPKLDGASLKVLLLGTGTRLPSLAEKLVSAAAVDATRALKAAELSAHMTLAEAITLSQAPTTTPTSSSPPGPATASPDTSPLLAAEQASPPPAPTAPSESAP